MPKVSVIIPIYGVEKYIERCAESLFQQTLEDIEYIFVDDCTPDNSIEILKKVVDRYPNIKNQIRIERMPENGGLAAVRKYGTSLANGDYIAHCDSDDWVSPEMYEKLYGYAVANNSDLVFCDYIISNGNVQSEHYFSKNITNCSKKHLLDRLLVSSALNPVWSALAKRDLYNGLMFPVGDMSEDKTIMMQLVWKAKNASYLQEALYYYFLSDTSILRTINKEANIKKFKQIADNRRVLLGFFDRENIKISQKLLNKFLFAGKIGYIDNFLDDPDCKILWTNTFPISAWSVLFNPYINIKSRLKYLYILLKQKLYY